MNSKNKPINNFSWGYYIFLIIFLGLLSAFGPFITDMYLPTLPSLVDIFDTSPSLIQMGLTTSMIGLAIGQLIFGPLSDRLGRRPVLMAAMIIFSVSTIICIYSTTIHFFNLCRFFQGLGGAGGIVLSRSISTDCYSGRELTKTLAIIGAVNGIAPVTAPVIGGLVAEEIGWKGIFWILLGIGSVLLFMCFIFRESHPQNKHQKGSTIAILKNFGLLLKLRYFIIYVLIFAFANGILFSYISSASFIIQNHFGYSELIFSLIFGVNALGIGLGAALCLKFKRLSNATIFGATSALVIAVLQFLSLSFVDSLIIYELITFLILMSIGFIFTASTTLAMEEGREYVGVASALFGASGFLFGGIVSPLVGIGNILSTTAVIMLICSILMFIFAWIVFRRNK